MPAETPTAGYFAAGGVSATGGGRRRAVRRARELQPGAVG